jgi:hypothetical protein
MGQGNLLTGWMMLLSDWRAGLLQPNHRSLHIFHALARSECINSFTAEHLYSRAKRGKQLVN